MKQLWPLSIVLMSLALVGCAAVEDAPDEADSAQPELTWVMQNIVGGRQCESGADFSPPETEALLAAEGVTVHAVEVESMAVCMACGCPSYAAQHYAHIEVADLDAAANAGFRPVER